MFLEKIIIIKKRGIIFDRLLFIFNMLNKKSPAIPAGLFLYFEILLCEESVLCLLMLCYIL